MPIYEYQCEACGHRFERRQGFHDAPVTICPECGGATRRLLQAPPIIFKGSGWYATDSRPPQPSSSDASSKSEGAPKGGSTGGSSPSTGAETRGGAETESKPKD